MQYTKDILNRITRVKNLNDEQLRKCFGRCVGCSINTQCKTQQYLRSLNKAQRIKLFKEL